MSKKFKITAKKDPVEGAYISVYNLFVKKEVMRIYRDTRIVVMMQEPGIYPKEMSNFLNLAENFNLFYGNLK